jgi:predicted Zn-dependent protease
VRKTILFSLLGMLVGSPVAKAQNPTILHALKDELARSMGQLQLETQSPPYYVAYQVSDDYSLHLTASSGALTINDEENSRTLKVDLRVGDYSLDNSHFQSMDFMGWMSYRGEAPMPLDDDYDVLRRTIWLDTDGAYKGALETLSRKKAYLQNTIRTDSLPDFTKGEKFTRLSAGTPWKVRRNELAQWVEQASQAFLKESKIHRSEIDLETFFENDCFVNSEGVESAQPRQGSKLVITASTQADDGMPLKNFKVYVFPDPSGLPDRQKLAADIAALVSDLMALRAAPVVEDYSGPVLFEQQAAAEILAQGFVPLLLAKRKAESDNAQFSAFSSKNANPLLSKVNTRVLPRFVSLKATPAVRTYKGVPLLGSYDVDDEGVRAREVSLVEDGFLKGFLLSRSPIKGFGQSNGHFRGASTAPSVVRFLTTQGKSPQDLKKVLIGRLKEDGLKYGYLVRSILPPAQVDRDGNEFQSMFMERYSAGSDAVKLTNPVRVYRVYPDGKEELVRGAEFENINVRSFKDLLGTGKEEFIYNYPVTPTPDMSFGRSNPNVLYATIIAPSFILADVDIKKTSGNYRQPPIVSHPAP